MSAGVGISSFVDGFFRGREIRNGWEDRKDDKKRQAKLDEYRAAAEARAAEQFGWQRDQNGRNVADYNRERADDEELRRAMEGYAEGEPLGARPQDAAGTPTTGTVAPTLPDPVAGVAANLGIEVPGAGNRAAEEFMRARPIESFGAVRADPAPVAAPGPRRADAPVAADPAPATAAPPVDLPAPGAELPTEEEKRARWEALKNGSASANPVSVAAHEGADAHTAAGNATYETWKTMSRAERKHAGLPQGEGEAQFYFKRFQAGLGAIPHQPWGESLPGDVGNIVQGGINVAGDVAADAIAAPGRIVQQGARVVNQAVNPAVSYATGGYEFPVPDSPYTAEALGVKPDPASPAAAPLPTAPAAPMEQPGPTKAAAAKLPAAVPTPAEQATAQTAVTAAADVSTPAMEAAVGAVPALGAGPNEPITESQRNRAADAFTTHYRENRAQEVIRVLMKQGKLDQAMKFQEFMDKESSKAGMKSWARATFAASVGDFDGFADEISDAYNRLDYFGDGTTVVKDQSGFTKDKEGNITGAKITFRDEATGKTFEQVFENPQDLVHMGITMLSPEVAFAHTLTQMDAAREDAKGVRKEQAAALAKLEERIDAAAKAILEASAKEIGSTPMSYDEARRVATESILGPQPGAAPAGPPPDETRP